MTKPFIGGAAWSQDRQESRITGGSNWNGSNALVEGTDDAFSLDYVENAPDACVAHIGPVYAHTI